MTRVRATSRSAGPGAGVDMRRRYSPAPITKSKETVTTTPSTYTPAGVLWAHAQAHSPPLAVPHFCPRDDRERLGARQGTARRAARGRDRPPAVRVGRVDGAPRARNGEGRLLPPRESLREPAEPRLLRA